MPTRANRLVDDPLPRRLPVLLRHSWYALNQAFRRRIAPLGMTPDQFTVLRNLAEEPGLTQRMLCVRMASDPNTVAALTARMEAEGWIKRTACRQDRRANRLRLRAAGKRKLTAAQGIALGLQDEISTCLRPAELELFLDALSKVAEGCRRALREGPKKTAGRRTQTASK